MSKKLKLDSAPRISNFDVKYKGFHLRQKMVYIKFINNEMKKIHNESIKELNKIKNEQHNKLICTVSDFYDICEENSWKIGDFNVEKCISDPIFEGIELVFNSIMKNMKSEAKEISGKSDETLDDKEARTGGFISENRSRKTDFCKFVEYIYKKLNSTCSYVLDIFDKILISAGDYAMTLVNDKFGIHTHYLMLSTIYITHEIIPKVVKENMASICIPFFTKNLKSLISDCFKEYENMYKNSSLSDIQKNVKKMFENCKTNTDSSVLTKLNSEISEYIEHELKSIIFKKQKHKTKQLIGEIGRALDIVFLKQEFGSKTTLQEEEKKNAIQQINAFKIALSDLLKILKCGSGKLKPDQVELFDKVFRSRSGIKPDYKLSQAEINYLTKIDVQNDGPTARVIINLFSIITDDKHKKISECVSEYVNGLLPNSYPTYNCTILYNQLKESEQLIKNNRESNLLYTLRILKRILKGETPFFSTKFISNIRQIFDIEYDKIKIKSNEFAFRVEENLTTSENNSIQKLMLSFLEKTNNDKNFIVNKIKEQIAKSKPVKSEPTESKSTESKSTESESTESESTESRSDKKGANKHQRKKARNKKKKRK